MGEPTFKARIQISGTTLLPLLEKAPSARQASSCTQCKVKGSKLIGINSKLLHTARVEGTL
eukprot:123115-Pelagomonas_calceolata.AAC.5